MKASQKERKKELLKGVPLLQKIPLLGNLFKSTRKVLKKTELVVFINSKTIRKSNDMKEIVEGVKKMFSDKVYMNTKDNTNTESEEEK